MSLTEQFLISLTLPTAFLALFFYYRRDSVRSERTARYWMAALLCGAFWAGSILSFYGGTGLPQEIAFLWRAGGRHALSLFSFFLLLTTTRYLWTPPRQTGAVAGISLTIWLASLLLDPALWPYRLPLWTAASHSVSHFEVWAGVWVASWFLPLLASSLLTRQATQSALSALYRNRLNYWLLTLLLFALGGVPALIQQRGQPIWQELGALSLILATTVGIVSLTHPNLPNLQLALRRMAARLTATLLIFGLTLLGLWFVTHSVSPRGQVNTILDLAFVAALFTALFIVTNRLVPRLIRRIFLPATQNRVGPSPDQQALAAGLLDPALLGDVLLRQVQQALATGKSYLFMAEDVPGGALLLRPLAYLGHSEPAVDLKFDGESPFATYLRRDPSAPLSAYEINNLPAYATMARRERESLLQWRSELFMPLCAGQQLVGLLLLGEKVTGEPYTHADFSWLREMAARGGPLLWQAHNVQNLQRVNDYAFGQLQTVVQDKQQLEELLGLHERFVQLVSPSLRKPFGRIYAALQELEAVGQRNGRDASLGNLNRELAQLRVMINNLILTADRVQKQRTFYLSEVRIDEAIDHAIRNLSSMASARRVNVEVGLDPHLPLVQGDEQRLVEAIQYLLHNAIKFNKIGGTVSVECGAEGHELFLHVRDSGVGIPPGKLDEIWSGFVPLQPDRQKSSPGLGLVLARFIVQAHGGRLEVKSNYGSGSIFSIYLPLVVAE